MLFCSAWMCCLQEVYVFYCNMFSVVNVYLDQLKFCVVCITVEGMSVVVNVMLSLMSVMSPPPALCNISMLTVVKLCTLGVLNTLQHSSMTPSHHVEFRRIGSHLLSSPTQKLTRTLLYALHIGQSYFSVQ